MRIDTTEYKQVVVSSKYVCDKCGCEIKKDYDRNVCEYEGSFIIERSNEEEQDIEIKTKLELCTNCDMQLETLLEQHGFKFTELSVKEITRNT